MKSRFLWAGLVSTFLCASVAQAAPVAWFFQGTVTNASGAGLPGGIAVGDAFSLILHFDSGIPVSNPGPCGTGTGIRCFHNGSPSLYFSDIRIGGISVAEFRATDPAAGNSIIVRDNAVDPGFGDIVDGLSFSVRDWAPGVDPVTGENTIFSVILRGPEDLGSVVDGRFLPTTPHPSLLNLRTHGFQVCDSRADQDCYYADLGGDITSISVVPEPASLALLGIAVAGLGWTTRRRSSARAA